MVEIIAELTPLDPVTGSRVTMRVSSIDHRNMAALNGQRWWPAISTKPKLSIDLFDGNFQGDIQVGSISMSLNLARLRDRIDANVARFRWGGATIKVWYGDASADFGSWVQAFDGIVDGAQHASGAIEINGSVRIDLFDVNLLTTLYQGTGGAEGGADIKNKPKPFCAGSVTNAEPVLIDAANSVYQYHGYGPTEGVATLYENGASFGAAIGDYASYTALTAATIAPGYWATCKAEGMLRLGAPAREGAIITIDVNGDKPSGVFLRKTGEIISRLCTLAGIPGGNIDSASLAALDIAVARNIRFYLTDQTSLVSFVQRLARPCNASAGISHLGKLFVARTVFGSSGLSLNGQGRSRPTVREVRELAVSAPYWRYEMMGVVTERVHSFSEIAYQDELIERGVYSGATVYRGGNIVSSQGARWVYVNPATTSGNAPPTLPATSNSFWSLISPAPSAGDVSGLGDLATQDTVDYGSQVTGPDRAENGATRNIAGNLLRDPSFAGWSLPASFSVGSFPAGSGWGAPPSAPLLNIDLGIATGASEAFELIKFPVVAGEVIFARVRAARAGVANQGLQHYFAWYDAAGALVGASVSALMPASGLPDPGFYGDYDLVATAPANTAWARHIIARSEITAGAGTWRVGLPLVTRHQPGADVTVDQPVVSRLNETTGTALGNFISSNGLTFAQIALTGEARDGIPVDFPATLPKVPRIIMLYAGNAATAGQNIRVKADGVTTTGFTPIAKSQSVTPGSVVTDTTEGAGGGANPDRVINRSSGSAPFDGLFEYRVSVTVGNLAPGEPGYVQLSFWARKSGVWVNVGSQSYATTGSYNEPLYPGTVDFGAGEEFGVSLEAAEGTGSALSDFVHVKYTPGTVTETSLTPAGASAIPWIALLQ